MLRTNLSTKPFYNERAVMLALAAVTFLVLALTVFNIVRLMTLTNQDRALVAQLQATEQKVQRLRQETVRARSHIDRKELEAVAAAAREANTLIDERTFSWTELLNRLEATLPPDVRVQSITPVRGRDGRLDIRVAVVARRAEDVDAFIDQLEKNGGFRQVISQAETTNPEGQLLVSLQGQYLPKPGA